MTSGVSIGGKADAVGCTGDADCGLRTLPYVGASLHV